MVKSNAKTQIDICECGHGLNSHDICDCPHCLDGVHECYSTLANGEYCDCEQYVEKSACKPRARNEIYNELRPTAQNE